MERHPCESGETGPKEDRGGIYSRKKSYTAKVGRQSVVQGRNGQQDDRLCKGATASKVLYGNSLRLGLVLLRLHSTDRSWLWSAGTESGPGSRVGKGPAEES